MKWLRRLAAIGVVVVLALGVLLWASRPTARPGQLLVPAKTAFTKGAYFAYAQPWGGESNAVLKYWARHADALVLNLKRFPNGTQVHWRWPPLKSNIGPGVWGFDGVMHGNYDGGIPEHGIAPIRVRDLKTLHQSFAWTLSETFGSGNVLTEFYLRSDPANNDAKVIEIGWLLHMPSSTRKFFDNAKPVGLYVDPQGRRWMVRIAEKFCMFAPERPDDLRSGTIDMLAALKWLQDQGRITGNEWMSGSAIGVEPVTGFGKFTIDRWSITMQ